MKKKIKETLVYIVILSFICIASFLFAKYMVRKDIGNEPMPIDTSERLN